MANLGTSPVASEIIADMLITLRRKEIIGQEPLLAEIISLFALQRTFWGVMKVASHCTWSGICHFGATHLKERQ